jgi:hypothetical protein
LRTNGYQALNSEIASSQTIGLNILDGNEVDEATRPIAIGINSDDRICTRLNTSDVSEGGRLTIVRIREDPSQVNHICTLEADKDIVTVITIPVNIAIATVSARNCICTAASRDGVIAVESKEQICLRPTRDEVIAILP